MTDLTTEQRAFLDRAIDSGYTEIYQQMDAFWATRDLSESSDFIFRNDGIKDLREIEVPSNLYATLSFSAHMTRAWSWSMGDVFSSLTAHGNNCVMEQNGLSDIPECFSYLEREFGCTAPEVPEPFETHAALFKAMMSNLTSYAFHSTQKSERDDWFTKDLIEADESAKKAVIRLIRQLTEGIPLEETVESASSAGPKNVRSAQTHMQAFSPLQFGFSYHDQPNQENTRALFNEYRMGFDDESLPKHLIPEVVLTQTPGADKPDATTMSIRTPSTKHDPLTVGFDNLNAALSASVNDAFAKAVCWQMLRKLSPDDVDDFIGGLPIAVQSFGAIGARPSRCPNG